MVTIIIGALPRIPEGISGIRTMGVTLCMRREVQDLTIEKVIGSPKGIGL
jgi:hypothetical protein